MPSIAEGAALPSAHLAQIQIKPTVIYEDAFSLNHWGTRTNHYIKNQLLSYHTGNISCLEHSSLLSPRSSLA